MENLVLAIILEALFQRDFVGIMKIHDRAVMLNDIVSDSLISQIMMDRQIEQAARMVDEMLDQAEAIVDRAIAAREKSLNKLN